LLVDTADFSEILLNCEFLVLCLIKVYAFDSISFSASFSHFLFDLAAPTNFNSKLILETFAGYIPKNMLIFFT